MKIADETANEPDVVDRLRQSIRDHFQGEIDQEARKWAQYRPKNIYASGFHPCVRRLYHDLVDGDKRPPWSVEQKIRFMRGNLREVDWSSLINNIGARAEPAFHFEGSQERIELRDRKDRVLITGRIDGRIRFEMDGSIWPCEIKSWAEGIWRQMESVEAMLEGRFTRGAVYQLLAYLFGKGEPRGLFWLDGPGFPKMNRLVLEDHLGKMEAFLVNAEAALDAQEADEPPDPINRPELCSRCWANGKVCFPDYHTQGVRIVDDVERETKLARYLGPACQACRQGPSLEALGKEAKKTWDEIRGEWKGIPEAICGDYHVQGLAQKKTTYNVPADVKLKYKEVDFAGKWKVVITQIQEPQAEPPG